MWMATLLFSATVVTACGQPDSSGTAWGEGSFSSNGERIYFTATSETTGRIDYSGGVDPGGLMMGGRLSCASCHGTDARGGVHRMHMEVMDAPAIRWAALSGHGDEHDDAPPPTSRKGTTATTSRPSGWRWWRVSIPAGNP